VTGTAAAALAKRAVDASRAKGAAHAAYDRKAVFPECVGPLARETSRARARVRRGDPLRVDSPRSFRHFPGVRTLLALAILLAAASGGCRRDKCVPTCEKNSKELGCRHADHCKAQCDLLHKSPVCLDEMKAFEVCFLAEPTAHWICDEEDIPALSPMYCQPERARVVECLNKAPRPSEPPSVPPKKP
jgi:hypothetical protein